MRVLALVLQAKTSPFSHFGILQKGNPPPLIWINYGQTTLGDRILGLLDTLKFLVTSILRSDHSLGLHMQKHPNFGIQNRGVSPPSIWTHYSQTTPWG